MHCLTRVRQLVCLLLLFTASCIFISAQSAKSEIGIDPSIHGYPRPTPLQPAVDEFNLRAKHDPVGSQQPVLTPAEIIAALRALGQNHSAIKRNQYLMLQSIANTKVLPKGAYLRFIPGLIAVEGYDIDVWWIDLQLDLDKYPNDLEDQPMHTYRLRTVFVSSRPHS